jgi:hypothetical protein
MRARNIAVPFPTLPYCDPDATVLGTAAIMARHRAPLVTVFDESRRMPGTVTPGRLLDRVVGT